MDYRSTPAHPFVLAQQMVPGSYVSAETALGFHGWIPEMVHSVLSVTARGKSVSYDHETLGKFEFRRMTVASGYWLQGRGETGAATSGSVDCQTHACVIGPGVPAKTAMAGPRIFAGRFTYR